MSHAIDRAARAAALAALAGALMLIPLGAGYARAPDSAPEFRLAQAPSSPGPGATPPRSGAAPQSKQPAAQQPASRDQQVERQTAELKKQLQITPNQESQFDAFAQVMRGNAQAMDSMIKQQSQNPPKNAVDDLKSIQQLAETQLDGLKKLLPAFQSLYDSLSDQQKKTADSIFGGNAQGGGQPAPRPRG
jgi:protein CpxP